MKNCKRGDGGGDGDEDKDPLLVLAAILGSAMAMWVVMGRVGVRHVRSHMCSDVENSALIGQPALAMRWLDKSVLPLFGVGIRVCVCLVCVLAVEAEPTQCLAHLSCVCRVGCRQHDFKFNAFDFRPPPSHPPSLALHSPKKLNRRAITGFSSSSLALSFFKGGPILHYPPCERHEKDALYADLPILHGL